MIRVIVIDDEPVIVRNTSALIERNDSEFKVVGSAMNGEQGYEMIQKIKPDLVFVDISMPVLTGIDMIERLREENNQVPVVILSGYTEFKDAQRAIQLGALDYLVKPVNPLKFTEFLNAIKKKLSINYHQQHYHELRKVLFYPTKDMLEENQVCSQYYQMAKLCIGPFQFYRNNNFESSCPLLTKDKLVELIVKIYRERESFWIIEGRYLNELIIIFNTSAKNSKEKLQQLYDMVIKELENKNYITLVCCEEELPFKALKKGLIDIDSSLYHNSLFSKSYMIDNVHVLKESQSITSIEPLIKLLQNPKIYEKENELIKITKKILDICKQEEYTQAMIIKVVRKIDDAIGQGQMVENMDILINNCIVNSVDYNQLLHNLTSLIHGCVKSSMIQEDIPTSTEAIIIKVQKYLDRHYSEKILIQDIADRFGFNDSYLCILFKKYLGNSPNEYLINTRIKAAKELLKTTSQISIKDVAESVGYSDPYYFSRLFKSNTGLSPSEYKRSMR